MGVYGEYDETLRKPVRTPAGDITLLDPSQFQRGQDARTRGDARDRAEEFANQGDYESASGELLRYDPQQAAVYDSVGDKKMVRDEKRKDIAYKAAVAPLIANQDYKGAEKLTAGAGRPLADIEQIRKLAAAADKDQLEHLRALNEKGWRGMQRIEAMPLDQRQAAYSALRDEFHADGLADTWPPQYSPGFASQMLTEAQTADQIFNTEKEKKTLLTPAEAAAAGLRPGTVAERDATGGTKVVQEPPKPGGSGRKMFTEGERNTARLALRVVNAAKDISAIEKTVDWDKAWRIYQSHSILTPLGWVLKEDADKGGSDEERRALQAIRGFVTGVMRKDSGAAIADNEWTSARQLYFPVPGDGPQTVEQKRRARDVEVRGLIGATAGAYADQFPDDAYVSPFVKSQPAPDRPNNPDVGDSPNYEDMSDEEIIDLARQRGLQ